MNLFGSCMEKNSDRALLLFGDWRKSLFFSPAPLTPLHRLAPPVQGRWEWRLGGGGAEWGDCLGILLRRERARSLCSGSPQRPWRSGAPGSRALEAQESGGPQVPGHPASSPTHFVVRAPTSCYRNGNCGSKV